MWSQKVEGRLKCLNQPSLVFTISSDTKTSKPFWVYVIILAAASPPPPPVGATLTVCIVQLSSQLPVNTTSSALSLTYAHRHHMTSRDVTMDCLRLSYVFYWHISLFCSTTCIIAHVEYWSSRIHQYTKHPSILTFSGWDTGKSNKGHNYRRIP